MRDERTVINEKIIIEKIKIKGNKQIIRDAEMELFKNYERLRDLEARLKELDG